MINCVDGGAGWTQWSQSFRCANRVFCCLHFFPVLMKYIAFITERLHINSIWCCSRRIDDAGRRRNCIPLRTKRKTNNRTLDHLIEYIGYQYKMWMVGRSSGFIFHAVCDKNLCSQRNASVYPYVEFWILNLWLGVCSLAGETEHSAHTDTIDFVFWSIPIYPLRSNDSATCSTAFFRSFKNNMIIGAPRRRIRVFSALFWT